MCGRAYETSSHIPRCTLYTECGEGLQDRVNNFSECMVYWDRVVKKRSELMKTMQRPILGCDLSSLDTGSESDSTNNHDG